MKPNVEVRVKLDKFVPRHYQTSLWDALENKGYRKIISLSARRSGKDFSVFNLMIRQMLKRVGLYWYLFPTYSQGRRAIWEGKTNEGDAFLSYIPTELIQSVHQQDMKIRLINGSVLQIIGAESYDRLVGANPVGCVFSEYAVSEYYPKARQLILPMLRANQGFEIYLSTPRGRNHFYELWNIAQANPKEWYFEKWTVKETGHISLEEIASDIEKGEISEGLAAQEYFCSFDLGISGSVYGHYMDKMRLEGRIGYVPYEEGLPVHVSFDYGMADPSVYVFYQVAGNVIRIIDYYENTRQPISHYARYLQDKAYKYGKFFPPHDIMVEEGTSGMTRMERFKELGINLEQPTWLTLEDGIEQVRATLPRVWIDERRCKNLIRALENYSYEYDEKKQVYRSQPKDDIFSHPADALRYAFTNLHRLCADTSPRELQERYAKAKGANPVHWMFDDRFAR